MEMESNGCVIRKSGVCVYLFLFMLFHFVLLYALVALMRGSDPVVNFRVLLESWTCLHFCSRDTCLTSLHLSWAQNITLMTRVSLNWSINEWHLFRAIDAASADLMMGLHTFESIFRDYHSYRVEDTNDSIDFIVLSLDKQISVETGSCEKNASVKLWVYSGVRAFASKLPILIYLYHYDICLESRQALLENDCMLMFRSADKEDIDATDTCFGDSELEGSIAIRSVLLQDKIR